MATTIISNAFSLNMLPLIPQGGELSLVVQPSSVEEVRDILTNSQFVISAVGHQATAEILSEILGFPVKFNRAQVELTVSDILIVAQLTLRLQEGQILSKEEIASLVEEGKLRFFKIIIRTIYPVRTTNI